MSHNEHTINDTYNDFFKNQEIQIKMDKFISRESMITLYAKPKKRHRCTEQTFRLCGRRQGWDVQREQHWNKYTIKGETDHQPRLDAWNKCSGLVHWEDPEGWAGEGGGSGDRDGEIRVNPWLIHVNIWQKPLQYCKVISLQLIKINGKIKKKVCLQ